MLVEDVLTPTSCVCRTEEGRIVDGESLLHLSLTCFYFFNIALIMSKTLCSDHKVTRVSLSDVKQDMLETVVPKSDNETIMVVLGEQRGQVSRNHLHRCAASFFFFFKHLCVLFCLCCHHPRWVVFFSGTRTTAEQWFSWSDTRRKCSLWTMTPFVTTLEGHNLNYRICFCTKCSVF